MDELQLLRLLQLADSALPIGATAHSFGLETLAEEGLLTVEELDGFFSSYLEEAGVMEAAFCRAAHQLASAADAQFPVRRWRALNQHLSALRPAREARSGSAVLGRRFLQLINGLGRWSMIETALNIAQQNPSDVHHCTAFGLAGATLDWDEQTTALAYLQQALAGLVSACQRLLPLGQSQAGCILWKLKPTLLAAVRASARGIDEATCFTPLPDIGALRHPALATRLFIS